MAASRDLLNRIDYRAMTRAYARKYGIPEELALAQIGAESGFNPNAKSPAGALGIAQFMPGTAKGLGINPLDPRSALEGYGRHMSTLLRNFKGNTKLALAAYNAGAGAVQKYGGIPPYRETQNYVSKIMQQVKNGGAVAMPAPARARRGGGGAAVQGGSGAAGAPGAGGSLQLDPKTQALIQRWMAAEDQAISQRGKGSARTERMWAQIEKRLMSAATQAPPAAQQLATSNQVATAARGVGQNAGVAGAIAYRAGGLTMGGGPDAHGSRALGNWQSDNAYDLMGKAGQPVFANVSGVVTKISGQPGGSPQFAGYGITVKTPQGELFFKHIGKTNLKVGQRVSPKTLVGTLDAATAGGPHLHLGGTNRSLLDALSRIYTRR